VDQAARGAARSLRCWHGGGIDEADLVSTMQELNDLGSVSCR
jgi:hypothetical protein